MTEEQRKGHVALMNSILACACCPPDIRLRAEGLLMRLLPSSDDFLGSIFGGAR